MEPAPSWAEQRRIACVVLPAFSLQLLLREHPAWRHLPVAVLEDERPDARLLLLNPRATSLRLRVGMRYGAAKNLVPDLQGAVVSSAMLEEAHEDLARALMTFSPRVESASAPFGVAQTAPTAGSKSGGRSNHSGRSKHSGPPKTNADSKAFVGTLGVFFVDPNGLDRLYGGVQAWAQTVWSYLRGRDYQSAVVVGEGRFATYAIATSSRDVVLLADAKQTRERLEAVPLAQLGLPSRKVSDLAALNLRTLGDLRALPPGSLVTRFGKEVATVHALCLDEGQLPLQPAPFIEPPRVELQLEPPDADHARLLFCIKSALHPLLETVQTDGLVLSALELQLELEGQEADVLERIEPAAPTRDARLLLELVRLRLFELELAAPVERIALQAETAPPTGDQLMLFRIGPKRDLRAGERAIARIRAAFGEQSVTTARLREAHLPEARFAWEPTRTLRLARHRQSDAPHPPPLVRRVFPKPLPLPPLNPRDPAIAPDLAIDHRFGPYRVSGGWWVRPVERDYYYLQTTDGEVLWVYWDRPRQRWFQHGVVD